MKKQLIALTAITSLLLGACGPNQTNTSAPNSVNTGTASNSSSITQLASKLPSNLATVQFAKHVDGDTSKFIYKGKQITVRYLLIDTPETVHPTKGVQPFGKDASNYTKDKLTHAKKIQLDFDKTGSKGDKYGRTLAYVYVDGKDLNEDLVSKGLARVAYIYAPNTKNVTKYQQAEAKAKKSKLGIWSLNGYVTNSGYNSKGVKAPLSVDQNQPVKSSIPSKTTTNSKQPTSVSTTGNQQFKNCTDLRKVYPYGVTKNHPAYQAKMDRDHDGSACEL